MMRRTIAVLMLATSSALAQESSLAWGKKVEEAFRAKVRAVAGRLQMDPDHLMTIMAFETNGSFDPAQETPNSRAVGLIQFMPDTARRLGTTVEALKAMDRLQQLDFVEKYLTDFSGRMRTLTDAYLAVLLPSAMGRPADHVLFDSQGSESSRRAFTANRALDTDGDGKVQRREVTAFITRWLERGRRDENRN